MFCMRKTERLYQTIRIMQNLLQKNGKLGRDTRCNKGELVTMQDTITDAIVKIKNAAMMKRKYVALRNSKMVRNILKILEEEGYIEGYSEKGLSVSVKLKYDKKGNPSFRIFKRISKPSLRVYKTVDEIVLPYNGLGKEIISTSRGVMSTAEAKEQKIGGEIICQIF